MTVAAISGSRPACVRARRFLSCPATLDPLAVCMPITANTMSVRGMGCTRRCVRVCHNPKRRGASKRTALDANQRLRPSGCQAPRQPQSAIPSNSRWNSTKITARLQPMEAHRRCPGAMMSAAPTTASTSAIMSTPIICSHTVSDHVLRTAASAVGSIALLKAATTSTQPHANAAIRVAYRPMVSGSRQGSTATIGVELMVISRSRHHRVRYSCRR